MILICLFQFGFLQFAYTYQVVIDPGHGGSDRGAVRGENVESQIALTVAAQLSKKLKATEGIEVIETRSTDKNVPLKERVNTAEQANPDIFISIHVNSSDDPKARGVEFYFSPSELIIPDNTNVNDDRLADNIMKDHHYSRKLFQSKELGKSIASNWQDLNLSSGTKRRKLLQAPFYVVSKTKVPSILIELGFLSHPHEATLLRSESHQQKLAEELYQGILVYIQSNSPSALSTTVKK
jgi:N-acetylmuramoyl-L-alanine amidase